VINCCSRYTQLLKMFNKVIFVSIFFCWSTYAKSQMLPKEDNWLPVLDSVSIGWKNDSLTNTGYRYKVKNRLFECSFKDLTEAVLFEFLGKPAAIQNWEINNVNPDYVSYRYYFWTDPDFTYRKLYISFVFDRQGKFLFCGTNLICG